MPSFHCWKYLYSDVRHPPYECARAILFVFLVIAHPVHNNNTNIQQIIISFFILIGFLID